MTRIRTTLSTKQWREQERLLIMATALARDYAVSIIQSGGVDVRDSTGRLLWYDVDLSDDYVKRAVAYLDGCGLLRHHRQIATRVMLRWERLQ